MSEEIGKSFPPDSSGENWNLLGVASTPQRFPVINLGHSAIRESVFRLISAELMRRYRVVAFGYDQDRKTVSIACVDPSDSAMFNDLSGHLSGMKLELFQAEPEAIGKLIDRLAPAPPISSLPKPEPSDWNPENMGIFEPPASETSPEPILLPAPAVEVAETKTEPTPQNQTGVLFITQSGKISPHLMFALTAERLLPRVVSNMDTALTDIQSQAIDFVFVEKGLRSKFEPLVAKVRAQRPAITVRYFTTETDLLLNNTIEDVGFDLFHKNLKLLRHLTSGEHNVSARHAVAVARLADAICSRLNLPVHLRQIVATAASLHNIAEQQLSSTDGFNRADIIGLSAGRIAGWDYPPLVVQMLRSMYRDFSPAASCSNELPKFSGSILTAADCFCHTWPDTTEIASHQMSQVEQKLRELVGTSVNPEILGAIIDVVYDDLTAQMLKHSPFRVHMFVSRGAVSDRLYKALDTAKFAVSESRSIDECARFCRRHGARSLIIRDSGSVQDVYDTIISLAVRGVVLDQTSTILLLENDIIADATRLLRHGVEDIIPANCDPIAVIAKLERMQDRFDESTKQRLAVLKELGTHGSLEDMSLVDLLEVWRTNKRPVRIDVSAQSNQLTIFLDRGRIVHAECLDDTGTDAILKGMVWQRGVWNIQTIDASELPEPTLDQDITSVLLEACVRLDQASHPI